MAGRGQGRGGINLSQVELDVVINTRVVESLEAFQVAQPVHHNPPACTYKSFIDFKPHNYCGTEGPVGLLRWFEKTESVLAKCNCPDANKVVFVYVSDLLLPMLHTLIIV